MNYYVTRQLGKAIDKLSEELHETLQQQIRATRDASEATNQAWKEIPPHLSELRVPENEKAEARTYRQKTHRQQVILTWGTWLAFLAAATYAGIAVRQLHEMRRTNDLTQQALKGSDLSLSETLVEMEGQIEQMSRLADSAQRQATTARKAFEANDRPYVDFTGTPVSIDRDKHIIAFSIGIMNTGNIPAEEVEFNCDVYVGDFREPVKRDPPHTINARTYGEQRFSIAGPRGVQVIEGQQQLIAYCSLSYKWRNNRETRCAKRTYVPSSNIFIEGSECEPKGQ